MLIIGVLIIGIVLLVGIIAAVVLMFHNGNDEDK